MKIGDVVTLNSGGPLMTIAGQTKVTNPDHAFECVWFDANNILYRGWFRTEMLRVKKK